MCKGLSSRLIKARALGDDGGGGGGGLTMITKQAKGTRECETRYGPH